MLKQATAETADLKEELIKEKKLREEAEKLSADFEKSLITCTDNLDKAKTEFAQEKADLLKRAEEADSKLKPVTEELETLKDHITKMGVAIFGKYLSSYDLSQHFYRVVDKILCPLTGRKSHNIMGLPIIKLKAIYKFLEQLYVDGAKCIMAVKNTRAPPTQIMEMIKEFSTVPKWVEELKKSACHQWAMYSLARAKAYLLEMDPALLEDGFLEFNAQIPLLPIKIISVV